MRFYTIYMYTSLRRLNNVLVPFAHIYVFGSLLCLSSINTVCNIKDILKLIMNYTQFQYYFFKLARQIHDISMNTPRWKLDVLKCICKLLKIIFGRIVDQYIIQYSVNLYIHTHTHVIWCDVSLVLLLWIVFTVLIYCTLYRLERT